VRDSDRFRPGSHLVTIEVLDTGSGIPEEMLGKVFEPFFTTKPTGQGTGLGLTVTKTIIDLHGGSIEIANRSEGGARVLITFNAECEPQPTNQP
jgi:signal transduction histidine kinase